MLATESIGKGREGVWEMTGMWVDGLGPGSECHHSPSGLPHHQPADAALYSNSASSGKALISNVKGSKMPRRQHSCADVHSSLDTEASEHLKVRRISAGE